MLAACGTEEPTTAATSPKPVAASSASLSWRERVAADLSSYDAKRLVELMTLPPEATPADPKLGSVILDRLARKADAEAVRVALADALPKTGGAYADALADLFVDEGSAKVRAAFVRVTPSEQAIPILRRAFADPSTEVRIAAARVASTHTVCERLASELRMALVDRDAALRTEAARSLGTLKVEAARDELVRALADASPDVRLEAMVALDKISPGSLAKTAAVLALRSDPDPRVAELATKLAVRQ